MAPAHTHTKGTASVSLRLFITQLLHFLQHFKDTIRSICTGYIRWCIMELFHYSNSCSIFSHLAFSRKVVNKIGLFLTKDSVY